MRVKVQREWEKLRRMGWSVQGGKWFATLGGMKRESSGLPPFTESQGVSRKRKGGIEGVSQYVTEPVVKLTEFVREGGSRL